MKSKLRAAIIAAIASLMMVTTAIPASAAATLTISPSTNLTANQPVTVSGTGLGSATSYTLHQCRSSTTSIQGCGGGIGFIDTDANGAFQNVDAQVRANWYDDNGDPVDCRASAGACSLSVFLGVTRKVSAPISFAPVGPTKRGSITATPANFVPDAGSIRISGPGWATAAPITAGYCKSGVFILRDCESSSYLEADSLGFVSVDLNAPSTVSTPNGIIDCTTPATACVAMLADSRNVTGTYKTIQLTAIPPVAGQIAISPHTELHNGDTVDVVGTGWLPYSEVFITQCVSASTTCVLYGEHALPASDGTFRATIKVADWVDASHVCSSLGVRCTIRASVGPGNPLAVYSEQPISFSSPPSLDTGTLHVHNPLAVKFGAFVVDLASWVPNGWVQVALCQSGQPISNANCFSNRYTAAQRLDELGVVADLWISNNVWGLPSECLTSGACEVVAWDGRDPLATAVRMPVTTTNGDGIIEANPTTSLHDQGTVTVDGYGWFGGTSTHLYQCPSAATLVTTACRFLQQTPWNFEPDHFKADVTVLASLRDGAGWYTDCSASPNACSIVITHSYDYARTVLRSIPISFTSTTTTVTSHYSAVEAGVVHSAAMALSLSDGEYQRNASWALMYLLGITNSTVTGPVDNNGPATVATTYVGVEYTTLHNAALQNGFTDAEFQKLSAMAVAYILSL